MKFGFNLIFEDANRCKADSSCQICMYKDYNDCFSGFLYFIEKKIL